jgi:pseudouridine-5'-phosphate glycosidase
MMEAFQISSFVRAALQAHRPVVALETTLVTHGLPYPQGVAAATELESVVVGGGAVPATIGVLDGSVHVGMGLDELHRLASQTDTVKLNLSNFAAQLAGGGPGSTTVAATCFVASRCGIEVFATGGIGGVHRDSEETGDVSADLYALARYPVAVVCAGAKAVLDLPKTVERLETLGVPIFGLGTDEFPAFYRRDSGLAVDRRFDGIEDLAHAVRTHFDLGLGTGVVVANPIPEEDEMPRELYDTTLKKALAEASDRGIVGRDVTPFLLERMRELTSGESVAVNLALLRHNARVAAALAGAMAHLR